MQGAEEAPGHTVVVEVAATRYLQELSAHWSSSKGAEVEGPTASMSRSVASSAALLMSSSAQQ